MTGARRPAAPAPADPVLARARRRIAGVTLALVGALVLVLGAASAVLGLRALDDGVDRALDAAATAAAGRYAGEMPSGGGDEGEGRAPQSSDTFFVVLDRAGAVVSNPSSVPLGGLPDAAALAVASAAGRDIRTVQVAAGHVRLETLAIGPPGGPQGWLLAGYVLALHDEQARSLVLTIAAVGLVGLLGAALVTVWITGRALVPIRRAFATERRFVADASHEIRTPAALIRASAEVLQREDLVRGDGRALAEDIVAEADRLGRLVEDLLALAASEGGALSVDRRPLDAGEVARDTVRRAGPMAHERGLLLVGPTQGRPLPVAGDPDRLVQLLLILVDNAFRVSPPGGRVIVEAGPDGRSARISVTDQGPGVPPAEREHIFEPFARLPDRTHGSRGSGLGLAIGRRIAELHGGTLAVEDAPGGGARFVLQVPLR